MRTGTNITTKRGSLENGLDAIENYLGLKNGEAAFINEFYSSAKNFPDLAEPTDWVLGDAAAGLAPVVMAGENAALLTLSCPKSLIDYLSANNIIPPDANVISICDPGTLPSRLFPEGAMVSRMQENVGNLLPALSGKIFVPSFVSPDMIAFADTVGGRVLTTVQNSIDFNSKSYLRRIAEKEGFPMPVGLIIFPDETLESGIQRFQDMAVQRQLPLTPAWLKFPSVAGGGTIPLPNGPDVECIRSKFLDFIKSANGSYSPPPIPSALATYDDIPKSMLRDLVLEFDIAARGDVRILGNYCVQAVIGETGVTYVGTTGQVTEDGSYMGGYTLSATEKDRIETILPNIFDVYESFQIRGYRGYIGVDALVVETTGGDIKAYILEANCRMNGSTPLLSLMQKLEATKGCSMYGESLTVDVPVTDGPSDDVMSGILQFFNAAGLLYQRSSMCGIIPFMPDVYPGRGNSSVAPTRCALIGRNAKDVRGLKSAITTLTREI